ncbi:hypothetical protein LS684_14735 [Cytobacillus spongiae]|uniref:hypothetical protein n=1 Tax=Cytobacillus spongiae TaxID=2901381 RepID=UPI001F4661CD|nr:hypothetical protein [Cytobacillus spongiae]UII54904.1 hypothetical protein LS684_14735 [Cytobacillus spongiae]
MNDLRKQIILKEIEYWKENRMLPEHYCNFLLSLYTEGNRQKETIINNKNKKFSVMPLLFLLIIPLAMFVIYFTELSYVLQIALVIFLVVFVIFATYYFFKKGFSYQIPLVVAALTLLLASVEFTSASFPNQLSVLYLILVLNCFLWLFSGYKLKLLYFSISGYLGIGLLIISIFI